MKRITSLFTVLLILLSVVSIAFAIENIKLGTTIVELEPIKPIVIGGISGWVDESSGPGLSLGHTSIVSMTGHPNAFMLDSLSGGNYYMEKAYYIDINNVDELNIDINWEWKQDKIASRYGLVETYVYFANTNSHFERWEEEDNVIGIYRIRRHTGEFSPYYCTTIYAEHNLPRTQIKCEEEIGQAFDWKTEHINLKELLDNDLIGVNKEDVKAIKIKVVSYNNAGAGVKAYWDNFAVIGIANSVVCPINCSCDDKGNIIECKGECNTNKECREKLQTCFVGCRDGKCEQIVGMSAPLCKEAEWLDYPDCKWDDCKMGGCSSDIVCTSGYYCNNTLGYCVINPPEMKCPANCKCDEEGNIIICETTPIKCPNNCVCDNENNIIECKIEIEPPITPPIPFVLKCPMSCILNDICVAQGTRVIINDDTSYCDINSEWKTQKEENNDCQNNYECKTNFCSNSKCYDISRELKETKSLLQKIFDWFKRLPWFKNH